MEKKQDVAGRLPESFWSAYLDLCLRQWMAEGAAKAGEGRGHERAAIAQGPAVEGGRVDTP